MRDNMNAGNFRDSIDRRLAGLTPKPDLAEMIISNTYMKATRINRPVIAVLIIVAIACAMATGALALSLKLGGIKYFSAQQNDTYVPPKYEEHIVKENVTVENEHMIFRIMESYYDGIILRLTAHVIPKEKTLLIGGNASPEDPVEGNFPKAENSSMTIAEYALVYHDGLLADISLHAGEDDIQSFMAHEDGSATIYMECMFEEKMERRTLDVRLVYMPVTISSDSKGTYGSSAREVLTIPMTFNAEEVKTYTCHETMDFPDVGVKVINVTMDVTPLEIRYTLDYEITDLDAFVAQKNGLWFEFIDLQSTEASFHAQRVSDGWRSVGSNGRLDGQYFQPDEAGTVYRQTGTIGLDAFGGQYTIRAYNAMDKTRFETRTFRVKE